MAEPSLYDRDIVAWADQQAGALRRVAAIAPGNTVDWANVIEEIECLGRSERSAVESLIENALEHLIKSLCDHDSLSKIQWGHEVERFLDDAREKYRPSMRKDLDIDRMWARGFRQATKTLNTYRLSIPPGIPATCPYTLDELLDETFTFDAALRKLHAIVEKWAQDGDRR